MIWYEIDHLLNDKIREVEVIEETDCFVTLKADCVGRHYKYRKESEYSCYYKTKKEAIEGKIEIIKRKRRNARELEEYYIDQIRRFNELLKRLNKLKEEK
jgi:hypothetical protein